MTNEINEAVKRIADMSDNELIVQARPIIAQQAAIIEQLESERQNWNESQQAVERLHVELRSIIEQQREALKLARDVLELCAPCVKPMRIQAVEAQIDKALTAIDNVMKGA